MGAEGRRARTRAAGPVGVLDIGSSKIACLIATALPLRRGAGEGPELRVLGFGHKRSAGIKAGVIIDIAKAAEAVKATLAEAERFAGVTLSEVAVSVSCGRLGSTLFRAHAETETGVVASADVVRLASGARAFAERDGRVLVHMNRLGWLVDGVPSLPAPEGMPAARLSADLHAVTADEPPLRNLTLLLDHCYVAPSALVAVPYASALAVTSGEERRQGVTVIDMGGGTTSFALFAEGELVSVGSIPVGGGVISSDIAYALHTPLEGAERIKTLYGRLITAPSDEHEDFSYAVTGEEGGEEHRTTKAALAGLIRPRMASTFALVKERLALSSAGRHARGRIVLTGGASQMPGMAEFACHCLGVPVRVGLPQSGPGLPPQASSPQFAAVAGLLSAAIAPRDEFDAIRECAGSEGGYLDRVREWLRQGF
jgi:cell division protein FtsA